MKNSIFHDMHEQMTPSVETISALNEKLSHTAFEPTPIPFKKGGWKMVLPLAACLMVAVGAGILALRAADDRQPPVVTPSDPSTSSAITASTTADSPNASTATTGSPGAASTTASSPSTPSTTRADHTPMILWEIKTLAQRFPSFVWKGITYTTYGSNPDPFAAVQLEKKEGVCTAEGFDPIEQKSYTTKLTVFSVKNVSPKAAIALQYSGSDTYYIAYSDDYAPATLGSLVQDFGLTGTLTKGSVYIDKADGATTQSGNYTVDNIEELVWALLNKYKDSVGLDRNDIADDFDTEVMVLFNASSVDASGDFCVTRQGYVYTTAPGNMNTLFYIGPEATKSFVDAVQKNSHEFGYTQTDAPVPTQISDPDEPVTIPASGGAITVTQKATENVTENVTIIATTRAR